MAAAENDGGVNTEEEGTHPEKQTNNAADSFAKWRLAIEDLELTSDDICNASNTRVLSLPFTKMMDSYNTFLTTRNKAEDAGVIKLGDKAMDAAHDAKKHVLSYLESPVSYAELIDKKLHQIKDVIDKEERAVRTRRNSRAGKVRKKRLLEEEEGQIKQGSNKTDTGDGTLEVRDGFFKHDTWASVQATELCNVTGPISVNDLLHLGDCIRSCGWISARAIKDLGYNDKDKHRQVTCLCQLSRSVQQCVTHIGVL